MIARPHTRLAAAVAVVLVVIAVMYGVFALLLAVLALGTATGLVLACQFGVMSLVNRSDPCVKPSLRDLLIAWWHESVAAVRLFGISQPWLADSEKDCLPPKAQGRTGVVFVHGFLCNRGIWLRWMRSLRRDDTAFVTVDLRPLFADIEDYADTVAAAVRTVQQQTGRSVVVVAHSMGGLVVRHCLRAQEPLPIAAVVTIATPHQGTWLARWGMGINAKQMRHKADWLQRLGTEVAPPFHCFWSNCDNIVFPASSATLSGADNIHLNGVAHLEMVDDPRVIALVDGLLAASDDVPVSAFSSA